MGVTMKGAQIGDLTGLPVPELKGPQPTQLHVDPNIVRNYAQTLLAGGSVPPIDIVRLPDGREFITEGHHRFVAGELTGKPVERKMYPDRGPVGVSWSEVSFKNLNND